MAYISFVGFIQEPTNHAELSEQYPQQFHERYLGEDSLGDFVYNHVGEGFRDGLEYSVIGGENSLTVWLAVVSDGIGHLVADCPAGGWVDECFCVLDSDGKPLKSEDNYNPNPVPQVI